MTDTPVRPAGVHPPLPVLGAYVDGTVTDGEAWSTEDHLMNCAHCRGLLTAIRPAAFPEVAAVRSHLLTDLPDQPP